MCGHVYVEGAYCQRGFEWEGRRKSAKRIEMDIKEAMGAGGEGDMK